MSVATTERLGTHNGMWFSGAEIQTLARDLRGCALEITDLTEDAILYIESAPYIIFLVDNLREKYFLESLA